MDGKILDPDGARDHLASWKGRIDRMAQDTEAMSQRLRELRVTASDPNGLSQVSVDSTGALVDLRLTDRIAQVPPDEVARAIMTTLGQARNTLADRSQQIIADTVGTESPAARAIASSVDTHLRRDLAPAPKSPRGGASATSNDDGYDVSSDLWR
ncbi:hypothetical protein BLA60_31790 [Actinophytocola xinjiangensis]|uniref:YbaB/EbfC DNA-binding family protein n=1 Tax=Actinophytocola xinjiangensis TaxID=485602 RepID=A0A7Z0WH02_9PSEU|nr:YbaB/EbfC family nucleoid-associated protein [Actinophytocola xinjiangensis]OLF06548.1 hypothetical protein BLA60_31790 [Actinophytocola xinjiangensis]